MKKILFITWERYHRRPEILAQHFNAKNYYISYGQNGKLLQTPFRYMLQGYKTWRILCRERPDIIFIQNPPIFGPLVIFLYSFRYSSRFIIDSHTGAFLSQKWKWSLGLHRMLSSKAIVTIVHNKSQEKIVMNWGCRYMVLAYTPGDYPIGESFQLLGEFNIAVICSFLSDEPIDLVIEVANQMPEVFFYVTGDSNRIDPLLLTKIPENLILTGYLPYERYVGLLRNVDAIMVLTTQNDTMLMGGFEAISLHKPLIISDWPILREYFSIGSVYVQNNVEGICCGVRQAQTYNTILHKEVLILEQKLNNEWLQKYSELQSYILEET